MKILINHLSLVEFKENFNQLDINGLMIDLAKSLRIMALNNSANNIFLTGNFDSLFDVRFDDKNTFRNILNSCSDRDAKGIILAKLSNYRKIDDLSGENIEFSISFFSSEKWKDIQTPLCEISPHISSIKNIPCLLSGDIKTTLKRATILSNFAVNDDKVIINTKYIDCFYTKGFEENFTALMRTSKPEKNEIIKIASELICKINGFTKDLNICKKNGRDIFYHDQKNMYLSIDYLHGTFEKHDSQGVHQGEISFSGRELESKDRTRQHDITIK